MSDFEYFKPYEGDKPYIFISYAHADDDAVLPIVSDMHRRGYNIWYDEGIEVGSEWQERRLHNTEPNRRQTSGALPMRCRRCTRRDRR